ELLHGGERHVVRRIVRKTHFLLRVADHLGERPAARDQHHCSGAARQHVEPWSQMRREGQAPAQLDDDDAGRNPHLRLFPITLKPSVMPGLVPGIHVLPRGKTWMAGTTLAAYGGSPGHDAETDQRYRKMR